MFRGKLYSREEEGDWCLQMLSLALSLTETQEGRKTIEGRSQCYELFTVCKYKPELLSSVYIFFFLST